MSTQPSAISHQPNPLRVLCDYFALFAFKPRQSDRKGREEGAKVAKVLS